jgi:hypothetical protein
VILWSGGLLAARPEDRPATGTSSAGYPLWA